MGRGKNSRTKEGDFPKITDAISEICNVDKSRIYILFSDLPILIWQIKEN
jgi:phenylpyruvate tautomerase PptA (4-oxalocrotonate tautomerase family)